MKTFFKNYFLKSQMNYRVTNKAVFGILFIWLMLTGVAGFSQQYVLNGTATQVGDDCYRLTSAVMSQAGSVWLQTKVSLAADLSVSGTLNFGNRDQGADGMAFVLQPVCNGLGTLGGGIGYQGISPSLAIEFDTWFNGGVDLSGSDHIALTKNGDISHFTSNTLLPPVNVANIENGADHSFLIEWNATDQNLKLTFNGNLIIDYTGDIVNDIFGGNSNVFWGFTGATGAEYNNQTVCISNAEYSVEGSYLVTDPSCPSFTNGAIDLDPAGGVSPFTYAWSNGANTEDVDGLSAGEYSVSITDGNGCQTVYNITVGNPGDTHADSDCDGVSDECDLCPGGNDSYDLNGDGIADCHVFPGIEYVPAEWICGNNGKKVLVCHIPPGNPANAHTICISHNAVQAHLNHGCYVGACNTEVCDEDNGEPRINIIRVDNESGSDQVTSSVLEVFPNPTTGHINILLSDKPGKNHRLVVKDLLGKVMINDHLPEGSQDVEFSIEQFPAGVYMLQISDGERLLFVEKIIKQ